MFFLPCYHAVLVAVLKVYYRSFPPKASDGVTRRSYPWSLLGLSCAVAKEYRPFKWFPSVDVWCYGGLCKLYYVQPSFPIGFEICAGCVALGTMIFTIYMFSALYRSRRMSDHSSIGQTSPAEPPRNAGSNRSGGSLLSTSLRGSNANSTSVEQAVLTPLISPPVAKTNPTACPLLQDDDNARAASGGPCDSNLATDEAPTLTTPHDKPVPPTFNSRALPHMTAMAKLSDLVEPANPLDTTTRTLSRKASILPLSNITMQDRSRMNIQGVAPEGESPCAKIPIVATNATVAQDPEARTAARVNTTPVLDRSIPSPPRLINRRLHSSKPALSVLTKNRDLSTGHLAKDSPPGSPGRIVYDSSKELRIHNPPPAHELTSSSSAAELPRRNEILDATDLATPSHLAQSEAAASPPVSTPCLDTIDTRQTLAPGNPRDADRCVGDIGTRFLHFPGSHIRDSPERDPSILEEPLLVGRSHATVSETGSHDHGLRSLHLILSPSAGYPHDYGFPRATHELHPEDSLNTQEAESYEHTVESRRCDGESLRNPPGHTAHPQTSGDPVASTRSPPALQQLETNPISIATSPCPIPSSHPDTLDVDHESKECTPTAADDEFTRERMEEALKALEKIDRCSRLFDRLVASRHADVENDTS